MLGVFRKRFCVTNLKSAIREQDTVVDAVHNWISVATDFKLISTANLLESKC
jgi:hypothetical protein